MASLCRCIAESRHVHDIIHKIIIINNDDFILFRISEVIGKLYRSECRLLG